MKRQLILVAFTLLGLRAVAEPLVTLSSSSALTATTAVRHKVYHGETVRLAHTFLARSGEAVDLTGCTADFYYQTPGMGATEWYKAAATVSGETVSVDWHAGMDPGGASVRYFFAISRDGGKLYRANGLLTLLDSPGFTPAVLEPADIRAEVSAEILAELRATDLADLKEQIKAEEARATEAEEALNNGIAQEYFGRLQADADLQTAINGKADTSHSHAWSAITNKPSTFAPAAHTHTIAEVADLQTAINGKADTSHSHALEDIPVSINGVPHIITWDTATETFVLQQLN